MFCNLNGRFYNETKAVVSVNNRSFRYGDGCFETIKVCNGKIVLADQHMERLFKGLLALQFQPATYFNAELLLGLIDELVKKNGHQRLARVRLTIFRGDGGLYDTVSHSPNFLVQSWPLNPENNSLNGNGLVIGTFEGGFKAADAFANIKSNNFLLYAMAALHAKKQNWNDALVLNHKGTFADASIANLFIVSGNTIVTPPLSDGPVSGVMRRHLLEHLTGLGYNVQETSISSSQLQQADECFLTNAVFGLKWVKQHGDTNFEGKHAAIIHRELVQTLW